MDNRFQTIMNRIGTFQQIWLSPFHDNRFYNIEFGHSYDNLQQVLAILRDVM